MIPNKNLQIIMKQRLKKLILLKQIITMKQNKNLIKIIIYQSQLKWVEIFML